MMRTSIIDESPEFMSMKKKIKLNRQNNFLEYHFPQKHKLEGTSLKLRISNIIAHVWLPQIYEFNG